MGSVGDAYDNAMAESFFATLECELIDRNRFKTQAEARSAVFAFIEGFYNSRRRHSALGYLSPIEYERRHSQTASGQPEPAAVLAPLKARPSSAATRGKDSATAGLDRRCARGQQNMRAGTSQAEQRNWTKQEAMMSDQP
jgi:hypothetical protein